MEEQFGEFAKLLKTFTFKSNFAKKLIRSSSFKYIRAVFKLLVGAKYIRITEALVLALNLIKSLAGKLTECLPLARPIKCCLDEC